MTSSHQDYSNSDYSNSDYSNSDYKELPVEDLIARIKTLEGQLQEQAPSSLPPHRDPNEEQAATLTRVTFTHRDGYEVIPTQRVAVLVDVQNMYYAARNLFNSKLEFSKLLHHLSRNRVLSRAIAYVVERPGMEQSKFIEVLRRNGYEVRKKVLIERSDGSQKGDWDLGMALDAVAMCDKVDAVCIVTGDGDFITLCEFLQNRGIRAEVASFPETTAVELIRSCNYYHRLDENVLMASAQFVQADENREPSRVERPANRIAELDKSNPQLEVPEPTERFDSNESYDDANQERAPRTRFDEFDDDDDDFKL